VGGGEGGGGEGGGEGGGGEGGGEGCVAETTAHWPKTHTTASSRAMPCGAELPTRGVDGPRPLLGLHCGAAITTCFERHWLSVERSSVWCESDLAGLW